MALADLLDGNYHPFNGYDNEQSAGGFAPVPIQQADVLRQVSGNPQQAAERSANGYGGVPTTSTPSRTKTGNARQDWMSLVQGLPANTQSIAQAFPQFEQWYPGSSFEKADLKGPWGWADT